MVSFNIITVPMSLSLVPRILPLLAHAPWSVPEPSYNLSCFSTQLFQGIMYLGQPLIFALLHSWPNLRRPSTVAGLGIMCVALAASSFSTNTTHLILTQGVLYAIGGSVAYAPTILFVDEWFVRRKSFAFGVMWVCWRDSLISKRKRLVC